MRFTISLGLLGVLATLTTNSYGHITAAPHMNNKLLPRATTTTTATSSAQVYNRSFDAPDYSGVRDPKPHQCEKRVEKNVPGIKSLGTDPLVSALRNIPNFAKYATGIITNRFAHGGVQKHGKITGLSGVYKFTGNIFINGQKLISPISWSVRWDYDSVKKTCCLNRHVNVAFGKGADNPEFAYTFSSGTTNYGVDYMWDAISNLIKSAEYDVQTSAATGTLSFLAGTTEADAIQAIAELWKNLLKYGSGPAGSPIDNPGDPNAPPT